MNTENKNLKCEIKNCENNSTEKTFIQQSVNRNGKVYPLNNSGVWKNVCLGHYYEFECAKWGCD